MLVKRDSIVAHRESDLSMGLVCGCEEGVPMLLVGREENELWGWEGWKEPV